MTITLGIPNLINFFMISMGVGVCGLFILQIRKAPIRRQIRRYFILFLWMVIGYITLHLTRELLNGRPGEAIRIALRLVTFFEFLISGFMTFMLSLMILYIALPEKNGKTVLKILVGVLALHTALMVVSQFTDLCYLFDSANVYRRTKLYLLSNLAPALMIAQDIYLLIRFRGKFTRRTAVAFWIYLIAPLLAMLIQSFYAEVQFIIFATVGAAVNMFAVITNDLTKKYEDQRVEASRIDTELTMATRIQADMLPNIFPAFPDRKDFDIYASMKPAKEVGGDFYDFFLIDEDRLGLVIADVSGKGVPAALFMMASKILIQNYAMMKKDPKAALEAANEQICLGNREEMFVTVWLGILDLKTGLLTAANAGHEYPILKNPGGKFEIYTDKHGFVIGGMSGIKYKPYEIQLEKGSMLFLYTDGVAEATDAALEQYGTGRLVDALNAKEAATPRETIENIYASVDAFVNDAPQFDDLTMMCIKYNGQEK